jgi:hypothetical protein
MQSRSLEENVSTKPSELMMNLLQELAMLKQLDKTYDTGTKVESDTVELEQRQRRRQEIADQIKTLGAM